jgi:hypothetical protein
MDIPPELMSMRVSGDWIFRPQATAAQKAAGLGPALSKATSKTIKIEPQSSDRDIIAVSGTYNFKPLEGGGSNAQAVQLFFDTQDASVPIRSTTLASFFDTLSSYTGRLFILDTPPTSQPQFQPQPLVRFAMHGSFNQARANGNLSDQQIDQLLGLVSQQTGLELKKTQRKIDTWKITVQ